MKAIDQIQELYVTETELESLLMIDTKRIRDLRSHHKNGKEVFIDHIKVSGKSRLYPIEAVMEYLNNIPIVTFGSSEKESETRTQKD